MAEPTTFAIVGAGLAGAKAAETLRAEGFDGRVVLFGAEPHLPYERPPLSKGYLQGRADAPFVHPAEWYAEQRRRPAPRHDGHRARPGRARGRDGRRRPPRATRSCCSPPGRACAGSPTPSPCARSTTATGSAPPCAAGVRVVIVGAGWIGLEVAAAARAAGAEVTVLEQAAAPLLAVLGPEMAAVFARLHVEHGVDLRCGVTVARRAVRRRAARRRRRSPADLVVAGIGVTPDVDLARAAGLAVDNGVVVDEHLRSSDPDVLARRATSPTPTTRSSAGTCAWSTGPTRSTSPSSRRRRCSARTPSTTGCRTSSPTSTTSAWSTPGSRGGEVVVRGDVDGREFVAFWLRDGRLTAAMNVNVWTGVPEAAQRLIRAGARLDAAALADPAVPLDGSDAWHERRRARRRGVLAAPALPGVRGHADRRAPRALLALRGRAPDDQRA